jgi:hypothetical protein
MNERGGTTAVSSDFRGPRLRAENDGAGEAAPHSS